MSEILTDIVVIGAGAVGLSTAYQLLQQFPELQITVIEKEPIVSAHQTGNNSGVIHSGIYYKPGSLKATLCVRGRELIAEFAKINNVKCDICGKVIVATDEAEIQQLNNIYDRGIQNGLSAIQLIDSKELKDIEPYCAGIKAVYVPYTGIIDFKGFCESVALLLQKNGKNKILLNSPVKSIKNQNSSYLIITPDCTIKSKYLIACAGLHSDRIAQMEGVQLNSKIVPFRGDYYHLIPAARHKVKNLIYPVPNPSFPFLGVHFTRMVDGEIECGPSAVFSFKREGYTKTDFSIRDTFDSLTFSGTWNLFFKHWKFGLSEYRQAFSKKIYLKKLQRLIPSLEINEIVPGRSGVRAMALNPDGTMVDDFVFAKHERSIHVINAPSPAATSCLAIGEEIAELAKRHFSL